MNKTWIVAVSMLVSMGAAGSKKIDAWKYAGEDHGLRFFFKAEKSCQEGPIMVKLENSLSEPIEVSFRVVDTDWRKVFLQAVGPMGADSSLVYTPPDGAPVCYPFFDRIYLAHPIPEEAGGNAVGMISP